jgi:hypothetical protein
VSSALQTLRRSLWVIRLMTPKPLAKAVFPPLVCTAAALPKRSYGGEAASRCTRTRCVTHLLRRVAFGGDGALPAAGDLKPPVLQEAAALFRQGMTVREVGAA